MWTNEVTLKAEPQLTVYHPSLEQYLTSIEHALSSGDATAAQRVLSQLQALVRASLGTEGPVQRVQLVNAPPTTAPAGSAALEGQNEVSQSQPNAATAVSAGSTIQLPSSVGASGNAESSASAGGQDTAVKRLDENA